jgi:hypothetical protein
MAETITNDERIYQGALNEDRNDAEEEPEITTEQSSRPDFVTYMFIEGLIALPGDLLKFIPVIGTILAVPSSIGMWFWRTFSSRFKKSPLQKIMVNGLVSWLPLSNTFFVTSCYIEETKLGKSILGKFDKSLRITGN